MQQIDKRLDFNAESTGASRHERVLFSFRLCHNKNSRTEILILDLTVKSTVSKACRRKFCLYVGYMSTKIPHTNNVLI